MAAQELAAFIQTNITYTDVTYTADASGKITLPAAPEKANSVFAGWYDENGDAYNTTQTLALGTQVTLTPKFVDVSDKLGTLVATGNETDDNPVPATAKYTNGLYIQGAQVRTPVENSNLTMGLRFVTVVNNDLINKLKSISGITDVMSGTLVGSTQKVTDKSVTVDSEFIAVSQAVNTWRFSTELNSNYNKYTVCVTNIKEENFETKLVVRPFIKYTDASGNIRYIYGEQYSGASLFDVASYACDAQTEDAQTLQWLKENIVNKCKGDNDFDLFG